MPPPLPRLGSTSISTPGRPSTKASPRSRIPPSANPVPPIRRLSACAAPVAPIASAHAAARRSILTKFDSIELIPNSLGLH